MKKRICAMACSVLLLTSLSTPAFATNNANISKDGYIEKKDQIYFDNIELAVADNSELVMSVSSDAGYFSRKKAQNDINELNEYLEKYPETEAKLIDQVESGTLCALGYTETPLVYVEDHYERVAAASTNLSKEGAITKQGYFSLMTTITRVGSPNSAGEYLYNAMTGGEWSKNSILGGSNYPAAGEDSVGQTVPNSMTLSETAMIAQYNNGQYGTEGADFHLQNSQDHLIHYKIKDDPVGSRQLKNFSVLTNYYGPAKSYTRVIHSKYVHTWKSGTVNLTLNIGVDVNPQEPILGINVSIAPSIEDYYWELASFVSFNF